MKLSIIFVTHCVLSIFFLCHVGISEKIAYISVEHPHVTYYNPKVSKYTNLTCRRYGRNNPVYYVGFNVETLVTVDNSFQVDIYFFELLTNQYKRSFVEMHFAACDLLEKDPFLGAALKLAIKKPCPLEPGIYRLENMTIDPAVIPRGFPFTQGRIYLNVTQGKAKTRVADGYIDMSIKYINKESVKKYFGGQK